MATLKQRKLMIKVAIFARGPTNLNGINMSVNSIIIILYHRYSFPLVSAYTHPPTHSQKHPPKNLLFLLISGVTMEDS